MNANESLQTLPAPFEMQFRDHANLRSLYLCVLVRGTLPSGERGYCYFGIFANTLVEFLNRHRSSAPFNPKQIQAIVLARSSGEIPDEIAAFMRSKFSFCAEKVILEISRK